MMLDEDLVQIVRGLRRTAADSLGSETFQRALARLTESPGTDWRSVMGHIADLIERGACRNVYDDMAYGSCQNGFKCSVCGCRVEDEEHYRVSGVWNFCPGCGRVVRHG